MQNWRNLNSKELADELQWHCTQAALKPEQNGRVSLTVEQVQQIINRLRKHMRAPLEL